MKKMNKLVALLLAAVMVLGMMPTMSVHAHAHGAEVLGIEEYPALPLNTETFVDVNEYGKIAYFTFTPEATDLYHFYSSSVEGSYADTYGYVYDAQMNMLASNDDAGYPYAVEGITGPNFCVSYVLEAGTTYILAARLYSSYTTGSFNVAIIQGHEYTSAVTKESTCTEDGILTYTCAHCGDSYEEVIPAAHTYSEDDGKCIHCGEAYLITGTCGDNLTWSLDWFGKLTISGTGDMYHYVNTYSEKYPAPWYDDFSYDIKTVVVEDGVTSIGNYAFYQCGELTTVELADSVAAFGSNTFASCYALESIALPTALTEIPERCFSSCGALAEIVWNENLTTIGSNAFYGCALGDTVLPEGITTIGQYAFGGCGSMTKLTLPSTLSELATYALSSMWNTRDFVFTGNAPVIGANAFNYINATVWYPLGNETWTEEIKQNYGGTLTWKGICTGAHTFGQPTVIEATCETGSYMTTICTVCGYTTTSPENDDALGHDYQYESYNGGCGDYSYTIVTCSRCDYYGYENYVWNEHSYTVTTVAATCTEWGYDLYECSVCGDNYKGNMTEALGHSVESWGSEVEATCTTPGTHSGRCSTCGQDVTEETSPALGHNWDEENGTANDDGSITYTCTRCDATKRTEGTGLFLGDNIFSIDGGTGSKTKTFTAEADGTLTIKLNNMTYHNSWAYDNGYTDQYWQTLGTKWVFDEGYFNVYINGVNTTYTANGEQEIIFAAVDVKSGDQVTVEVNHLESSSYYNNHVQFNLNLELEVRHDHNYTPVVTAPTCTEAGYTTYTCSCGDSYIADETAALGHTEETLPGTEPTFDAPGQTEGKKCSVCGEILTAQETIPALDYNEGIVPLDVLEVSAGDCQTGYEDSEGPAELAVDNDPNTIWHTNWYGESRENHWFQFELTEGYTVDGLRYWPRQVGNTNGIITKYDIRVSNDGVNFTSVASGNWEGDRNWKVVEFDAQTVKYVRLYALDALTDNNYVFACAAEIRLTGEKAAVHEHAFGDWTTTKEATCTEEGSRERVCECGEKETEVIAALGHTAGEAVKENEKAATCTEAGSYESVVYCSVCNAELSRETVTVDALGHDYVAHEVVPPTCSKSGYTVYKCTRCGRTYKDDPVEPEHQFDEGTVTAPTCTEQGYTTYTCLVCGDKYVDEASWTDALGHDFVNGDCSRCDTVKTSVFTDVPVGAFYFDPVAWAVEKGITNGATATTFNPGGNCQRAQVVTFLWRAAGSPEPTSTTNPFKDVKPTDFYYKAVLWAVEKGITNGLTADTFGPFELCNRAQVVTFLWRAMGSPASTADVAFTDVQPGQFYSTAVAWAVEKGITNGISATEFGVGGTCNRAQVVTFLYRAYN